MFVDQQKNCNTKKKTISDLRKWYGWCNQYNNEKDGCKCWIVWGKNHSARKTMVTCLTKNSVPETHIIQLTGHKYLRSLNSYKKASLQQQKEMSHVLSSYKKPETNPSSSYPTIQSSGTMNQDLSAQSYFAGATITNCTTINIGFPTATLTQSFTTMSAAPNDTQPQMK